MIKVTTSIEEEEVEPTPEGVIIYTKSMFKEGVLPEKGWSHNGELIIKVWSKNIDDNLFQILVEFEDSGVFDLTCLSFSEPLTLKETVIAAMVECYNNINTDYLSTEQVMDKYYDVMLEVSEGYVG
jgi:hypothetical protein